MYKTKSNGPKIEPWGTPHVRERLFEHSLSMVRNWLCALKGFGEILLGPLSRDETSALIGAFD